MIINATSIYIPTSSIGTIVFIINDNIYIKHLKVSTVHTDFEITLDKELQYNLYLRMLIKMSEITLRVRDHMKI